VFYENNVKQNSAILNERGKDIFDIYQMLNAICKTLNITIIRNDNKYEAILKDKK